MKKFLAVFLSLCLAFAIFGCSKAEKNGDDTTHESTVATDTELDYTPNVDRVITEIYGMFDERYDFIYEDVGIITGTFTANADTYNVLDELEADYSMGSEAYSSRPPAIRYVIEKFRVDEREIMKYFAACYGAGITDIIPGDDMISLLAGSDREAVMEACAHPSAFFKDGKIFSLRMILCGDTAGVSVSDEEIRNTVDKAALYYGDALFESERIDDAMRAKLISLGYMEEEKGGEICSVHTDAYHTIPDELRALVDAEEFEKYKNKTYISGSNECTQSVNICSFVNEFQIPMDKFVEIYDSLGGTMGNYNIELIYSGDTEAIKAYYSSEDKEAEKDIAIDRTLAALKEKIAAEKNMSDFVTNVHGFSLAEILLMIDKDSEYLASLSDLTSLIPNFDIESIYDNSSTLMKMLGKRTPYYIDRYVTGRLTFDTPYEARSAYN